MEKSSENDRLVESSVPPPCKFQLRKSRRRWQVLESPWQPEPPSATQTDQTMEKGSVNDRLVESSVPPPSKFQCRKSRRRWRVLESPRQPEPPSATQLADKVMASKKTKKRKLLRKIKRRKLLQRKRRQARTVPPSHQADVDFSSPPAHPPYFPSQDRRYMVSGSDINQSSASGALGQCASVVKPVINSRLPPIDAHTCTPDIQTSYFKEVFFSETPVVGTYMCESFTSDVSFIPSGVADETPKSYCSNGTFDCNSWQLTGRGRTCTTYTNPYEQGASTLQRPFISLPPFQPSLVCTANGTPQMPIPVQPDLPHEETMVPCLASTSQPYVHPHEGHPTTDFQQSVSERIVQDYTQPYPSASGDHEHMCTVQDIPVSIFGKKIVALDCEMVGCLEVNTPRVQVTGSSSDVLRSTLNKVEMKPKKKWDRRKKKKPLLREISVAGRCSIVDYNGIMLYDKYIKPKLQIINLRTRWSGIKRSHLKTAVPFDEARAEILELLGGCIVVGHALKNDTDSLNIKLPRERIRDTSRYVPLRMMAKLDCGQVPSLKKLAKSLLGFEIQKGSHSSLVDARVTMDLYKRVEKRWEKEEKSKAHK